MNRMSSIMWPPPCGHASCGHASCVQRHVITLHVPSIMWPAPCGHASCAQHHVASIMPSAEHAAVHKKDTASVSASSPWGPSLGCQSDVCPSTFNLTPSHLRELSRKCELTLLVVPWYKICCQAVAYSHFPHSRSLSTFCCFPWQEGKSSISGPWCL